jgi:hypothetical protein
VRDRHQYGYERRQLDPGRHRGGQRGHIEAPAGDRSRASRAVGTASCVIVW